MAKTRFHSALEARVLESIQGRMESIATHPVGDYSHYMHHVGYILGLKDALKIADEIEGEFDK